MSGMREKDSSDFDLERFVDLFDTAMNSDNPAVQRALKNLLMIAALVDSETKPEQRVNGPLRRLVDDIKNLNRRLNDMEYREAGQKKQYPNVMNTPWITTQPNTASPVYTSPGTALPGAWPPGTIIGGSGLTSGTFNITQGAVASSVNQKSEDWYDN
jgi:hypothetical protein